MIVVCHILITDAFLLSTDLVAIIFTQIIFKFCDLPYRSFYRQIFKINANIQPVVIYPMTTIQHNFLKFVFKDIMRTFVQ